MTFLRTLLLISLLTALACDQNKPQAEPPAETPLAQGQNQEAVVEPPKVEEPKVEEPVKPLTSKDFTEIAPDAEATAKEAPKAEDLARYTADLTGEGPLMAAIETSMGTFNCELFEKQAPVTVANFVGLSRGLKAWTNPSNGMAQVGTPLYQNVVFHRVIPGFMIQGGDPLGQGSGNPGYSIPDEFVPELRHDKGGLLSMANAGPATGGSQFFVTEVATPHLDDKHAIFGQCKEAEMVKEITGVPRNGMDRPDTDVVLKKITISRGS